VEGAVKTARERGDLVALARLDRSSVSGAVVGGDADHDLIGNTTPLPKGGDRYESAAKLSPGLYICDTKPDGCVTSCYTLYLKAGHELAWSSQSGASAVLTGGRGYPRSQRTVARQTHGGRFGNDARQRGSADTIYSTQWVATEKRMALSDDEGRSGHRLSRRHPLMSPLRLDKQRPQSPCCLSLL
jgi:hypothetical protein